MCKSLVLRLSPPSLRKVKTEEEGGQLQQIYASNGCAHSCSGDLEVPFRSIATKTVTLTVPTSAGIRLLWSKDWSVYTVPDSLPGGRLVQLDT